MASDWLPQGVMVGDGGCGTMLQAAGLPPGQAPEIWNLEQPQYILSLHKAYLQAGAQLIESNTFGGNRLRLKRAGLATDLVQINRSGVMLAKQAAAEGALVAAAIGPTGEILAPYGDLSIDQARDVFREQAEALLMDEPDILLIESMLSLAEAEVALEAVLDCGLPVIVQLSFTEQGVTAWGDSAGQAARRLLDLGAAAVGANCAGPAELVPVVQEMNAVAGDHPVTVFPNAGIPYLEDGRTIYPMGAQEFSQWAVRLVAAGARVVGGCCGTTPQHIRALVEALP
ncbi:MAG: homocysteine S-methyltransferase family protein [Bacillota bacterium]